MALDVAKFRELYPEFADPTQYPDAQIVGVFELAECWLGDYLDGCPCQDNLYYLLAAHLLFERTAIASGSWSGGQVSSSSVGGVSVSIATAPPRSAWQAWLSGSPYGLQLMALLRVRAGGGRYVGGSPERAGFRKIGGRFRPY